MGSVSFSLEGQVAVITGASRNIGKAIALAFAEAGADLFLVARNTTPLETVAEAIRDSTGRRVVTFGADVSQPDDAQAIFDAATDAYPFVDTLVNNAFTNGGTYESTFFDVDDSPWVDVLQTNLMGPVRLSRLFGKRMIDGDGGNIINVVSGSGFLPTPGAAPYGTSKAALWFLTRCLAAEGAPKVRANALCPGGVTEDGRPRSRTQELYLLPQVPMGRIGFPSEIAGAAVYLASPAASYTTGAVLVVNGGRPW